MTNWGITGSRWGLAGMLMALPLAAHGGQPLSIQILSPAAGECVDNNDPEPFQGVPGGEAVPALNEVGVDLRIGTPDDAPVQLAFFIDDAQEPLFEVEFLPPGDGLHDVDIYTIPPDFIEDGEDKVLRVVATRGAQDVEESVTFDLDREPPRLVFADGALDVLDQCFENPPDIEYEAEDRIDPNPQTVERRSSDGCFETQVVTVSDNCGDGNSQIVEINTLRQADVGDLVVTVQGFRCGVFNCITEGEDAETFADGANVGRGTAVFDVEAEIGCLDSVNAEFTVDGGDPQVLVPGAVFEEAGDYVLTVSAASCGDFEPVVEELRFTVVEAPIADPGGPYLVDEGGELLLDGTGSEADQAFGGIVEVAWDLDNDRFFEITGTMDDVGRVPFPTDDDGVFPVRLRITSGNGGVTVADGVVTVADVDPECDAGGPYNGGEGVAIELDGSGSTAGSDADPIQVYDWDFGDGVFPQRGVDATPNHIYGEAGEYTVTLRVEDEDSSSECEAQVNIGDSGPIIEGLTALNADNLVEGDNVCFSAGDTRPANGFDPIVDFRWTYGDDSPFENAPALRSPCHTYTDSGDFEVCLRVQDEDGDFAEECIDITVRDVDPICDFEGPLFLNEGQVGFFDASNSAGSGDLDPLTELVWDFGDGSDEVANGPDVRDVEHAFPDQGEYTVALTVRDEDSEVTCTQGIIINDVVPTAQLRVVLPQGQAEGREGEEITLDASGSRPGADSDPIVTYRWDFGDGTTDETENAIVQHAYPDQGVYIVRVTVVDIDGSSVGANTTVNVGNVAPRLRIVPEDGDQVEIGVQTRFTLEVQDVEADLPPPTVRWDMGDDTTYDDQVVVEHTYQALGEQVIRVTADDGDGGVAEAELRVEVTPAAPRLERLDPLQTCEGQSVSFRMQVDAALADTPVGCDGPLNISVNEPGSAPAEVIVPNAEDPDCSAFVEFEWTPTFFDSGQHVVRVTAVGPFTGISRTRDVVINVCEAGQPILASAGGTARRGVVTVYEFEQDGGRINFTPVDEVEVGLGATDMVVGPNGQRAYVASPGSGGVAVVQVAGEPRLLRRVPTGSNTAGVAVGGGFVWAVNAGDDTLTRIDPTTLKVDRTINLAPMERVVDVVWLPGDFPDLDGPRLALVSARSGHVALVDPAAVEAEDDGLLAARRLGGALTRVVGDPSTGWLNIIDGKTRMIYRLSASELEADPAGANVESEATPFAARDLLADDGRVLVATEAGVWAWEAEGGFSKPRDNGFAATALADVPEAILPGADFAAMVGDRVEIYDGEFSRLIGAAGLRIRRMAAFVARD